jgi:hypothetical protein
MLRFPAPISSDTLDAALAALLGRGRVTCSEVVDGLPTWDVADAKRRRVLSRDRSDGAISESGEIVGGWEGWLVQCKQRGMISLEAAIAESAEVEA